MFMFVRFMLLSLLSAFASFAHAVPIIFSVGGPDAAAITPTRDLFRNAIGGGNVAGANQSFLGIRREINWDGVPDAFAAPNNLPANFFNTNSPRGVVFSTPGTGFQVSANAAGVAPVQFGNINPIYPTLFEAFSPQRLFTALGSTVTDVLFFVPGTSSPGLTTAFGVVFSDVDLSGSTSLEFFDLNNNSLGIFAAPAFAGNETFSFIGVQFSQELIGRVRITSGNQVLAAGNNAEDLVVMDDFIFAEVRTIPEPSALGLLGLALLLIPAFVAQPRNRDRFLKRRS